MSLTAARATASPSRLPARDLALGIAAIVLLTFASYLPALHAGYIWDDDQYIKENMALRSPAGLKAIWVDLDPPATPQYYPMVFTTFWVEYHLWDLHWFGYHLDNLLLHTANALLLWLVLRRLGIRWAWLAAAIFAVHPLEVESVAWMSERKNVLCGFFYLLAALAWLRADRTSPGGAFSDEPLKLDQAGEPVASRATMATQLWLALAFVLYVLALLSKTVACTLPAALLLVVWWKRGRLRERDVVRTLPMILVGLALMYWTARVEAVHVGASGAEFQFTLLQRVLIAGRALWFYAGKLVWPHPLAFIYQQWTVDPAVSWQWLFPLGAVALIVGLLLWRRGKRGLLAAVLFFIGTIFPALGFVNIFPMRYSFVADHFQYLAGIGLIVLLAGALDNLGRLLLGNRGALAGAVVLVPLAVLTWIQCGIYRDRETLWRDTYAKDQKSWMALSHLAGLMDEQHKNDEKAMYIRQAVQIAPNRPVPHVNLAVLLAPTDPVAAEAEYKRALEIDPNLDIALDSYADFLRAHRRIAEAVQLWTTYVELYPRDPFIRLKLGSAIDLIRNPAAATEALNQFQIAVDLAPLDPAMQFALASALARAGRFDEALPHYRRALELNPRYPGGEYNLASCLLQLNQADQALPHFRAAVEQAPNDAQMHMHLAIGYLATHQIDPAIEQYQIALQLDPKLQQAADGLAAAQRAKAGAQPLP